MATGKCLKQPWSLILFKQSSFFAVSMHFKHRGMIFQPLQRQTIKSKIMWRNVISIFKGMQWFTELKRIIIIGERLQNIEWSKSLSEHQRKHIELSIFLSKYIYTYIYIYICLSLKAEDKINWTNIKEEMGFNLLLRVVESLYNGYG